MPDVQTRFETSKIRMSSQYNQFMILAAGKYQGLVDKINALFWNIENAYTVRREIYLHYNVSVNREAADAYLKIINGYKGFFIPLMLSAQSFFIIGLNQLVNSTDKRSIEKLVNKLQAEGIKDYRKELMELRKKHEKVLRFLTELRMEQLAHLGELKLETLDPVSEHEIMQLFEDTHELLDGINMDVFGNQVWREDRITRETIKDTVDVMNVLLMGEQQRLNNNHVNYLSKVYENGRDRWLNQDGNP